MRKFLLSLALLAMATGPSIGQTNSYKGTGILYTAGPPTLVPRERYDSEVAIDSITGNWYEYSFDLNTWLLSGERIQNTSGCVPPVYVPKEKQSTVVVNGCDSLYRYRGGAWRHLNKYSPGQVVSVNGLTGAVALDLAKSGNTLSLTGDASTVDLSGYLDNTDGQTLSVLSGSLSISGGNSVAVTGIEPVQSIAAGAGVSVAGTSTVTITNTGDTNASDDLTTATTAGGDLSGTFPNPQLGPDVVGAAELQATTVTAGTYGSSTLIPVITLDADGRATGVTTAVVSGGGTIGGSIANTQVAHGAVIANTIQGNSNFTYTSNILTLINGPDFIQVNPSNSSGHPEVRLFNGTIIDGKITAKSLTLPTGGSEGGFHLNGHVLVDGYLMTNSTFQAPGITSGGGFPQPGGGLALVGSGSTPSYITFIQGGVQFRGQIGYASLSNDLDFYTNATGSGWGQGSLSLRLTSGGNLLLGTTTNSARLAVSAATGYGQLNLAITFTPSSSADALGSNGDVSYDANYIYIKVGGSWKRSALSTF